MKMLTLEEFNELLEKLPFQDYLVTIASKHLKAEEWSIDNEILLAEVEGYADGPQYVWLNDWDEGQPFVMIMGFDSIQSIALSTLSTKENAATFSTIMKHSRDYYHKLVREELKNV